MSETKLRQAAFGESPVAPGVLAKAAGGPPRQRLLAAIVFGAGGHYAAAATLLGELGRGPDPVLAALALAAFGSHRRQLGGHAEARVLDSAALAATGRCREESAADPDGLDRAGAVADALLGLAADNLALGRLPAARRLHEAAASASAAASAPACWRAEVRAGWVGAEIELMAGDPASAIPPAEAALKAALRHGSVRHRTKSAMVLGAALAAAGEQAGKDRAIDLVAKALAAAEEYGLDSLRWPGLLLAADLIPKRGAQYRFSASQVLHGVLLRSDAMGRRIAAGSSWVPT
nr:hypothetical protein [Amycolatopsis nigrescens]